MGQLPSTPEAAARPQVEPPPALVEKLKRLKPNVFIAQPRRDSQPPLLQPVYEAAYVVTPFACKTLYGSTTGLPVDQARNELMNYALQVEAEYIWFVDDDTVVPYDGLQKLYHTARQGHPVVGGVVTQKQIG